MPDTTVTGETAATALTGAELARIVQGGNSRKTTTAVLGHQFRGAVVKMTSDDTTVNTTSQTTISFDSAVIDTDGFWSAGAPTRLTIPPGLGITHVELVGSAHVTASTGDTQASIFITHFNSSNVAQQSAALSGVEFGNTVKRTVLPTGPIAVDDNDYFTMLYQEESDTSVTIEGDTTIWTKLSLKVIGMEPV